MKVLQFPEFDPILSRLETVQNTLIEYNLHHPDDKEAYQCLVKVQEAIFFYNTAFEECPIPEIVHD